MTNKQSAKSSARDVFSYLLLISMFVVGVVSFLTLVFQYINVQFPDQLDFWYRDGALSTIRASISTLLVAWPVVIGMSILIGKDLRADVSKQYIWIRKWLLHLMLFVSAVTIIIDLIVLLNHFLEGELTIRFALKVMAVLCVSVAVFWYYVWELRRDVDQTTRVTKIVAVASSMVILLACIASLFVVGTPGQQRAVRLDHERASSLQSIQSSLISYWRDKDVLPETLAELEDDLIGYRNPVDPETQQPYEYEKTGELSFRLCAVFSTSSKENADSLQRTPVLYEFNYTDPRFDLWSYEAGRSCFDRTIDPDRFKDGVIY